MKFINYDVSDCAIIGDIHACNHNLLEILKLVDCAKRRKIISVGDIWDRGDNPNEVIDILYDLYKRDLLIPIVGNHELKYIRYFNDTNSRVVMGITQQVTLNALTSESIVKFKEIYSEEIVCVYDLNKKIFITHAPGGRPQSILQKNYEKSKLVIGGQPNITFEEFISTKYHNIHHKYVSTLLYGITNGDKTEDGFPIRIPIIKDINDTLDGWTYIYGHIHANKFYPELNNRCVCLDFCSPQGKIGGCVVDYTGNISLLV